MERKGYSDPLIFLDPAIVMCFEQRKLTVLIKRSLLEIQTRRVDVCGCKVNAGFQRLAADDCGNNCFSAVAEINLIAGFDSITALPCAEALCLQQRDRISACLAFGLALVQKCFITLAECVCLRNFCVIEQQCCMLFLRQQRLLECFQFLS